MNAGTARAGTDERTLGGRGFLENDAPRLNSARKDEDSTVLPHYRGKCIRLYESQIVNPRNFAEQIIERA
jgi:hypothetical protein